MKFTRSQDGIDRATIKVEFRFTKEELAEIERIAEANGTKLRKWIERNARDGVYGAMLNYAEEN